LLTSSTAIIVIVVVVAEGRIRDISFGFVLYLPAATTRNNDFLATVAIIVWPHIVAAVHIGG
jgi:hypothetical protein